MDKETRLLLIVVGIIFLGLLYCGLMLGFMFSSHWAQTHPIVIATIFALIPSLFSGSIWLISSAKAKNKRRLGL
ncbi:MAG: hypothetical protein ACRC2R_12930 [Xenococcaceae cyanobacterium]